MKNNLFKEYLSGDTSFYIFENDFTESNQRFSETILTLGNGFIGSRGILEENSVQSNPGTFIPGIYDRSGAQVEELVNLPNPINFMIAVEGEKFDIFTMKVLSHKRILDMKNGVLVRKTIFRDAKKRKFLYKSVRFFSQANPHIGAMKVSLKLLKGSASFTAISRTDDSVYNSGGLMLSRRRHFNTIKADKEGYLDYTAFSTHTYQNIIAYGDSLEVSMGNKKLYLKDRIHQFELKTGYEITFTKIFSIYTSLDYSLKSIKRQTMITLKEAVKKGFDKLFKEHIKAFGTRWQKSDIEIKGDYESQKAVRFNIYHLLIALREEYARYSIGAKTLSGQGYKGHIFWDTEIFVLPFFIYTEPDTARELLLFRYDTLSEAREIAKEKGYQGAMYPWETTINGTEQTPRYAKDVNGSIVEVSTQDFEHHITAAVTYGIYNYYKVTNDKKFILDYGAEIIFETARFWASRVKFSAKDGKYHINNVTGPDEFHVDVDDNAFTNYIAGWNLRYAAKLYEELKKEKQGKIVFANIDLSEDEIADWIKIASNMYLSYGKTEMGQIINQFNGYLRKKDVALTGFDRNFMPQTPKLLASGGLSATRFLKQADVLLLFCLFGDEFSKNEKLVNYNYYVNRTIHKSSLSYSMHSLLAVSLGDFFRAFVFFWAAINIDINDIAGNTKDGIHTANLGGVWQALLFGYGGVSVSAQKELTLNPHPAGIFKSIKYNFSFKGDRYYVEVKNNLIDKETGCAAKIRFVPKNKRSDSKRKISVFGEEITLSPNRYKTIKIKGDKYVMLKAKDIMKKENFVTAPKNMPIGELGKLIIGRKISSVAIVDDKKELIGIVSEKNIIEFTGDKKFLKLKADDIMEKKVVFVNYCDSIEKITKIFTKYSFRRLPVIDNKKVVGVITRRDIISDFLGGYY